MPSDLHRVTEHSQGRAEKGTWVPLPAPLWAGWWERASPGCFLSQGPGALCGRGEPLRHPGAGLPHAAPAAVPAPGGGHCAAAPMGLPQPRLPSPALPVGPAASGCSPDLWGQVRARQGLEGQGWVWLERPDEEACRENTEGKASEAGSKRAGEGWQGAWDGTSSGTGCQGCVWPEVRVEGGLALSPPSWAPLTNPRSHQGLAKATLQ